MLGRPHILMIRLMLYRALPHRRGEGGAGNVTSPKRELERQLRSLRHLTISDLLAALALQHHSPERAAALLKAAGSPALTPEQFLRARTRIRTRRSPPNPA